MIVRLAIRSLATRPVRTAVLACGFGFGIAVMAALLGVGDVILQQAHSPALEGGGDLVVEGRFGPVENARFVMSTVRRAPDLRRQIVAASPSKRATLYVVTDRSSTPVTVTGGIPSLQREVGDPETAAAPQWVDRAGDRAWSNPDLPDVLRAMDRFHAIPDLPEFSSSWAEWLYFNGHTADGAVRLYLTFLVGPAASTPGRRHAGVRLQLEREGRTTAYSAAADVDEAALLASAPDLDIAGNRVRLAGLQYRIDLSLPGAAGALVLDAAPGQSLPPATIRGARGWLTGYTAPVLSGTLRGALAIGADRVPIDAIGYHDHNWGFWKGVRWQWGQVANDDLSIVYGRVFPPADVADPGRMPGFLGVMGPQGPVGLSTTASIEEIGVDGLRVHAAGASLDLDLTFSAERTVRTSRALAATSTEASIDFLQLAGLYRVTGRVGDRVLNFSARGAAETFRPR